MNSLTYIFLLILYFFHVKPSYEIVYSCNSSAPCGCSTDSISIGRIVGGEEAAENSWHWAVSLRIQPGRLCGGSIISSQWIITAAHCVHDVLPSGLIVYVGSNNRWSGQSYTVANIVVHPSYELDTINDIALLRLTNPISGVNQNLKPLCLPALSSINLSNGRRWPDVNTDLAAVGWGRLLENGSLPTKLHQVVVKLVRHSSSTCQDWLTHPETQICAGVDGGGKDTCQGDSGGPLMMLTKSNQWVLVGITSDGNGCARPDSPGIYTWLIPFMDWIRSTTNNSSIEVGSSVYYNANNIPSSSVKNNLINILALFLSTVLLNMFFVRIS